MTENVDNGSTRAATTLEILHSFEWSATSMGPIADWPQSLKATIRTIMASRYPMILLWGEDLIQIYNEAYTGLIGAKHPYAFGRSIKETQRESWETIGPMIKQVMSTGISNWVPAQLLAVNRSGYNEETYFSLSYSAVEDDNNTIRGMLCVCSEVTQQVIGERRLRLQRDLAAKAGETKSVETVCTDIAAAVADYPNDVPFMLLYMKDVHGNLKLYNTVGVEQDVMFNEDALEVHTALNGGATVTRKISNSFLVKRGLWGDTVEAAAIMPVPSSGLGNFLGVLVAGISPNIPFDENYQSFLDLVTGQVSVALRNALAYEEEKKRAEALAELDRAKTSFFSNISHEFRTPLTLMLGPLEELLSKNDIAGQYKPELLTAHQNALRLLKLVNALLDFSRIEAGRMQATYTITDVGTLTAELASSFESAMLKAGLTYSINSPSLKQHVYVDREMWEKIVLNLISNALKFTLEGSVSVSVKEDAYSIILSVQDTGAGIPQHELPNVFKRFHRINTHKSRSHEGTGIGLALTKELVALHGGIISVASIDGQGTTFTVTIPKGTDHLDPSRIRSAEEMSAERAILNREYVSEARLWAGASTGEEIGSSVKKHKEHASILVVDDNLQMLSYLERCLSPYWEITTARDGQEAIEVINTRLPDLVISDVMMPKINGFELLQEIRANPAWSNIPVILLSARAGMEATIEGLERRANDYIVKPFHTQELIARVRTQLDIRRARLNNAILQESEKKFKRLTELLPEKVWIADGTGKIIFGNESLKQYTRLPDEKIASWEFFIHPDDMAASRAVWNEANTSRTSYEIECRFLKYDGEYRWHLTRAVPEIDEDGQIRQWVGTSTDIHERKMFVDELEKQVSQRTQDLKKINGELEQFAFAASHDLQEPLRKIQLYSSQLLQRLSDGDEQDVQLTEKIGFASNRLRILVRDLLDFSRLSEADIELEKVDLNRVMQLVIADYEMAIKQKSALVNMNDLPTITGYPTQMNQLFYNLIGNALKFTVEGRQPVISITANRLPIEQYERFPALNSNKPYWVITIHDNGIGFDDDYADQIFTIFKRLNNRNEFEGTGIGLALCKKIVHNHKGEIFATAIKNQGATFNVILPENP